MYESGSPSKTCMGSHEDTTYTCMVKYLEETSEDTEINKSLMGKLFKTKTYSTFYFYAEKLCSCTSLSSLYSRGNKKPQGKVKGLYNFSKIYWQKQSCMEPKVTLHKVGKRPHTRDTVCISLLTSQCSKK